ncbi:peptidase inhibitor 16 [Elysia marginata]|uniref:Peptidase inhibitor 16 n=1 Tax=Elysia marginata TaxID=1093978 RepID=A0AAV4GHF8_9GAST|nr:peptidase inhibitor 16 [Elysia marginata]
MVAMVIFLELVLLATTGCSVAHPGETHLPTSDLTADGGGTNFRRKRHAEVPRYNRSGGFNEYEATLLLEKHNEYRAMENASNMWIMEWNTYLQRSAQNYADKCNFDHSSASYRANIGGYKVGENIHLANYKLLVTRPATSWYSEKRFYRYYHATAKCEPKKTCGHYKQLVWYNSHALGCGIKFCESVENAGPEYNNSYLVVCHYGPNGNFRFAWPYRKGEPCSECDKNITPYCIRGLCSPWPDETPENAIEAASGSENFTAQLNIIVLMLTSLATLKLT